MSSLWVHGKLTVWYHSLGLVWVSCEVTVSSAKWTHEYEFTMSSQWYHLLWYHGVRIWWTRHELTSSPGQLLCSCHWSNFCTVSDVLGTLLHVTYATFIAWFNPGAVDFDDSSNCTVISSCERPYLGSLVALPVIWYFWNTLYTAVFPIFSILLMPQTLFIIIWQAYHVLSLLP